MREQGPCDSKGPPQGNAPFPDRLPVMDRPTMAESIPLTPSVKSLHTFLERVRASGVQHEIVPRRIQASHGGCRAVHRRLQARAVPFADDGGHLRQRVDGDFPAFEHLVERRCANAEGVREPA